VLSHCWLLEPEQTKAIRERLFDVLEHKSLPWSAKQYALQGLVVILATQEDQSLKELDSLFKLHLEPKILKAVDILQGVEAAGDNDVEDTKELIAYMRAFNALVLFSTETYRHQALDTFVACLHSHQPLTLLKTAFMTI